MRKETPHNLHNLHISYSFIRLRRYHAFSKNITRSMHEWVRLQKKQHTFTFIQKFCYYSREKNIRNNIDLTVFIFIIPVGFVSGSAKNRRIVKVKEPHRELNSMACLIQIQAKFVQRWTVYIIQFNTIDKSIIDMIQCGLVVKVHFICSIRKYI